MQLVSSELIFEAEIPSRTWTFFFGPFFLSIKKCIHEAQIAVTTLVDKKEWDVSYLEQQSGKGIHSVWRNLMESKKYVKGNKAPGVEGRMIQKTVL